jgi:hypothetical protein
MMTGFEAYKYNTAISMHFNGTYDAFKYNFKTRVSQKSYWGRPDKYQLTKIGKRFKTKESIIGYFAAHQLAGNKWVGDMIRDESAYTDYLKRIDSLSYNFKNELDETSHMRFDELLVQEGNDYPIIINLYLEQTVSIETVCILNKLTGFIESANSNITETILWPELYNKVVKYQQFLNFNKKKFIDIITTLYNDTK